MNITLPTRAIAAWYIIANIDVKMIQHMVERSNRFDANRDEEEFNQDAQDNAEGCANQNY
jgi:hypothetical protein